MLFYGTILWLICLADTAATAYGIYSDLVSEGNPLLLWFFERWGLPGLVVSKMTVHTLLPALIFVVARYDIARNKMTLWRGKMYFSGVIAAYLVVLLSSYVALGYHIVQDPRLALLRVPWLKYVL